MTRPQYPSDTKPRVRKRGAGQITLSLGDVKAELYALAADTDRTPSDLVREAVRLLASRHNLSRTYA